MTRRELLFWIPVAPDHHGNRLLGHGNRDDNLGNKHPLLANINI